MATKNGQKQINRGAIMRRIASIHAEMSLQTRARPRRVEALEAMQSLSRELAELEHVLWGDPWASDGSSPGNPR